MYACMCGYSHMRLCESKVFCNPPLPPLPSFMFSPHSLFHPVPFSPSFLPAVICSPSLLSRPFPLFFFPSLSFSLFSSLPPCLCMSVCMFCEQHLKMMARYGQLSGLAASGVGSVPETHSPLFPRDLLSSSAQMGYRSPLVRR